MPPCCAGRCPSRQINLLAQLPGRTNTDPANAGRRQSARAPPSQGARPRALPAARPLCGLLPLCAPPWPSHLCTAARAFAPRRRPSRRAARHTLYICALPCPCCRPSLRHPFPAGSSAPASVAVCRPPRPQRRRRPKLPTPQLPCSRSSAVLRRKGSLAAPPRRPTAPSTCPCAPRKRHPTAPPPRNPRAATLSAACSLHKRVRARSIKRVPAVPTRLKLPSGTAVGSLFVAPGCTALV
jgi:hypothetical protein